MYNNLNEAYENGDNVLIENAKKVLVSRIKLFAKDIHDKYIYPPETTDFAIMFLPVEGLYAEVVRSGLVEILQREYKINIAGPTTITALLNSVAMGMRTIAVNEKANEIKELLSAIKKQYENFDTILTKVRKKIDEAGTSLDEATKRNDIIQKKLKNIDAADSLDSDSILGLTE